MRDPAIEPAAMTGEQLRLHRAGAGWSLGAGVLAALLLIALTHGDARWQVTALWLGAVAVVLPLRVAFLRGLPTLLHPPDRRLWAVRAGYLLHGLVWSGAAGGLADGSEGQAYALFGMVLMSAGSLILTPYDLTAGLLFVLPTLSGVAWQTWSANLEFASPVLPMIAMFLAIALVAAFRGQAALRAYLSLRAADAARTGELQRSRGQLQQAQRVARLGSFDWDPVAGVLEWSDEHFRIWGMEPGDRRPDYALFRDGLHPDDAARVEAGLRAALASGQAFTSLYRVRRPDGSVRHVHSRGEVMLDATGRAVRVIGSVQDVTELREAQLSLQTYKFVVDAISDPVSVIAADGTYRLVNAAWVRATGLSHDEALGHNDSEVHRRVASPERDRALDECVRQGVPRKVTAQLPLGGHGLRWWETTFYPFVEPGSGARGAVVVSRDVTAQQDAQAAVARSLHHLRVTLNTTGDGIFASDATSPDQPLLFVNERMLQMWDIPPHRLNSLTPTDVIAYARTHFVDADREVERIGQIIESGEPAEDRLTLRDGRVLIRRCIPTALGGRTMRVWGFRDVTDQARAERQLQLAKDEAERATQAKSRFLARMSHELRTPMNAVLGFAQLLDADPDLPPQPQRQVREIRRAGEHMLALVDDLLDLGRIEAGRLRLQVEAVDPLDPLRQVVQLLAPQAAQRSVTIVLPGPDEADVPPAVLADRTRLRQVLLNVVGNAIKYNRSGGQVLLSWRLQGQELRLEVRDSGAGMSEDQLARLFEAFERLDAERQGIDGAGIGLALSRDLMALMNGRIGVRSAPDEGSAFWLLLPLAPAAQTPHAAEPQPAPAALTVHGEHDVLYVEDNEVNRMLVQAMLARLPGVRLHCAETPQEGLALAQRLRPSLVLLDIQLPEMDGYEVLRRLRADAGTRAIPVVAVTANAGDAEVEAGRSAGFDAYVPKPLDMAQLLSTVARQLRAADPAPPA